MALSFVTRLLKCATLFHKRTMKTLKSRNGFERFLSTSGRSCRSQPLVEKVCDCLRERNPPCVYIQTSRSLGIDNLLWNVLTFRVTQGPPGKFESRGLKEREDQSRLHSTSPRPAGFFTRLAWVQLTSVWSWLCYPQVFGDRTTRLWEIWSYWTTGRNCPGGSKRLSLDAVDILLKKGN